MTLDHETQRQIAQAVLKAYHIHPSVSNAFRKGSKNHRLYYSERASKAFPAILYWLDNKPEYLSIVNDFASKTGCMPFHATLTHFEFGDCLDILYVPADSAEVEEFLTEARNGYFRSYCFNLSDEMGESGYIKVRPAMGGIERIA